MCCKHPEIPVAPPCVSLHWWQRHSVDSLYGTCALAKAWPFFPGGCSQSDNDALLDARRRRRRHALHSSAAREPRPLPARLHAGLAAPGQACRFKMILYMFPFVGPQSANTAALALGSPGAVGSGDKGLGATSVIHVVCVCVAGGGGPRVCTKGGLVRWAARRALLTVYECGAQLVRWAARTRK